MTLTDASMTVIREALVTKKNHLLFKALSTAEEKDKANEEIRLVNAALAELAAQRAKPNNVPLYTNEQIDDIVDNHIFLDKGTASYRVWEDRANKHLRELRDKYEQEIAWWQQYGVTKHLESLDAKVQPMQPVPDWSQAPKWSNWWAVDGHNRAWWYKNKPQEDRSEWINDGKAMYISKVYPDWRLTLQARPAAEAGT